MDLNQRLASWRCGVFALQQNWQPTVWCGECAVLSTEREGRQALAIRTMQALLPDCLIRAAKAKSGLSAPLLQGP
ncbi:hypothetical protein LN449_00990, partial [Xanthomonas cannabis]|uniref:hypothetical protein n=1 Tax=Xanthomonas cannabis TaxID=1885674 RepID=UPI001E5CA933